MFKKNKKDKKNGFLTRMLGYEEYAFKFCDDSIKPLIHDFYNKCRTSKVKWDGDYIDWNIENLFRAATCFALNVPKGDIPKEDDWQYINGIMAELDKIYDSVLNARTSTQNYCITKIYIISEILFKNTYYMQFEHDVNFKGNRHDGKIFETYRSLYLIINLVNDNYDTLLEKGFSLDSIWYPFWEAFSQARLDGKPLSEEEKLKSFIGLINGTLKFHPIYEYKAVGYAIKPIDYNETIVNNVKTRYNEGYSLPQTDVSFQIEGEGEEQRLVRKTNTNIEN